MKRREFVTKLALGLAGIPVFAKLFSINAETPIKPLIEPLAEATGKTSVGKFTAETVLNNTKLDSLVKDAWKSAERSRNLLFLNRTPIVEYTDDEELLAVSSSYVKSTFFASDIVTDEDTTARAGSFEFVTMNIPNIKVGSRVGQGTLSAIAKCKADPLLVDKYAQYFDEWMSNTASDIVTGTHQRINHLLAAFMVGGTSRHGLMLDLANESTKNIHKHTPRRVSITAIKDHLKAVKQEYGVSYDRMTLSSSAFRNLLKGKRKFYTLGNAQQYLADKLKLEIELYDGTYRQKNGGDLTNVPFIPTNTVVFSNTKNDNNAEVFHFGNTVVAEQIIWDKITNEPNPSESAIGPFAYFTGDKCLNPPDIRAWGVIKGFPVLKDPLAFSSLRFTGMSDVSVEDVKPIVLDKSLQV